MTNQSHSKHTKQSLLANNDEFVSYMLEINNRLGLQGIKISARPMLAGGEVSKDLKCDISWNEELGKKIFAWFKEWYNDRLKNDLSIGKMVIKINQDPFLVKFPLVYGTGEVNPFNFIQDITPNFLNSLSQENIEKIAKLIIRYYYIFVKFNEHNSAISYGDIDIAVSQIMNQNPNYGLSKWASLQLAEKALKAYINNKGNNPPHSHNITNLVSMANTLDLPNILSTMINDIQCGAEVRYNEINVTLDEAIIAHHASLELCEIIVSNY